MRDSSSFYLKENNPSRVRAWLGAPRTVLKLQGSSAGEARIIVRRRTPPALRQIPSWLLRSVVTTVVLATIGFVLQRIFLSSYEAQNSPAAIERLAAISPGLSDVGFSQSTLALRALSPEQQALQPISRQAAVELNNAIPFSAAPIPAAAPFVLAAADAQDRERAAGCLARAIYYEAGGDTVDDERAVAQVVLNRVRHPLFPKTVCGVVFQGSQLKSGCQFTFTCDGSMSRVPEARAWARAQTMAAEALNGAVYAPVGYATHFHTPWVAPYWAPTLEKIAQVGGHLFYRWPGGAGAPSAFTGHYAGDELAAIDRPKASETPSPAVVPASVSSGSSPADPFRDPRKIEISSVDLPASASDVDVHAQFVAAPAPTLLPAGSRSARTYHPPIPRGGSAQPLLSRDR